MNRRHDLLARSPAPDSLDIAVPQSTEVRAAPSRCPPRKSSGGSLVDLPRDPVVAPYLVTTAPDVAISTNLAGFINKTGVFAPEVRRDWNEDPVLKWAEGPTGQHIELGISEMNLFLLLGQLGLSWDLSDQPLLPIGTVYDPFVCRGLDAFIYATYSGSRFVIAGTPSGVTLAPEGGAHQSTITAVDRAGAARRHLLRAGLLRSRSTGCCATRSAASPPDGPRPTAAPVESGSYYFRLTTRPIDQAPFEAARARIGDAVLRAPGARRRLPARRRLRARGHRRAGGPPGVQRRGDARGAGGGRRARRRGHRRARRRHHLARPAVRRVAAHAAPGRADRDRRRRCRARCARLFPAIARRSSPSTTPPPTRWPGSARRSACRRSRSASTRSASPARSHELYELHDLTSGSIVNAALAALSLG